MGSTIDIQREMKYEMRPKKRLFTQVARDDPEVDIQGLEERSGVGDRVRISEYYII